MKSWLFGTFFAIACLSGAQVNAQETNAVESNAQQAITTININQADVSQLRILKGVGAAKAVRIIEYRRQFGPFKSINELANIKGIGNKIIEKNRHLLTI